MRGRASRASRAGAMPSPSPPRGRRAMPPVSHDLHTIPSSRLVCGATSPSRSEPRDVARRDRRTCAEAREGEC
eukprot:6327404-Prymnesium_polylepis.1